MDSILHALGNLLLKALPTLILVGLLHLYLKLVFFRPMKRVLDQRYQATEGARKKAEESLARVAARTSEYEEALRAARADIYLSQDQMHRKLEQERAGQLQAARAEAERAVRDARAALALESEAAKVELARETDALADRIAETIIGRRAA